MIIKKATGIPLVLHDPYFSIWSCADTLNECDTVHWCDNRQKMQGYIEIDGVLYCFMGKPEFHKVIPQTSLDVTATATTYTFENEKVILKVQFTSPIILSEPLLVSRPCTYVDFKIERKTECHAEILFEVSKDLVSQQETEIIGGSYFRAAQGNLPEYQYAMMGRACQHPLGNSGDQLTIDWGYVYLASLQENTTFSFDKEEGNLLCRLPIAESKTETGLVLAYDDLISINYFGEWKKAYWTKFYANILEAIGSALNDREKVLKKARALDKEIHDKALAWGGESYAFLCNMSYRQTVAAHKLICDEEDNLIFLSKENDSNGCIGTVDVSYPSVPLFFLYDTEYVKGMLRPIFKFAACDVWEDDFAPHDIGRYPYAWGQTYGLSPEHKKLYFQRRDGSIMPPYYMYPAGSNIYALEGQMPVEECGNMLILMAAVCRLDQNADFARPHMNVLKQWVQYLLEFGEDPGDQLCTDDFGGHLAHNANLSIKAIMGIESYSMLLGQLGDKTGEMKYHKIAKEMAAEWEKKAKAEDHYMLAFGEPKTWSMKYNLVWDKLFESKLFSDEVYETELAWYVDQRNEFGTPLDSRDDISKSDWILWCATMSENREQAKKLIEPVAHYLENSTSRRPFPDFYETVSGKHKRFVARSVQGGIYMPLLREFLAEK